jgi:hypothetical protein
VLIAATGPVLATSGKLFRDTPTTASYGRKSAYSYALFQPAPKEASVGGLLIVSSGPRRRRPIEFSMILQPMPAMGEIRLTHTDTPTGPKKAVSGGLLIPPGPMRRNPVVSLMLQPRPNIGEVGRLILKITTSPKKAMAIELLAGKGW